ncbi:BRO1-domain-containing protein [Ceraceosorus guamensis]|uniref:BRO domain-containing protein 1 n=1 Tax=Ceraceosorus guamensis TaxID=1522189 RepID=A0A316VYV7_9BASI|nr:BRO1-domain-containing protein [Ceraceosorus guamensis]PWN42847.1 BRO1-domain-containing protein [Ceraceosorus guamensis]
MSGQSPLISIPAKQTEEVDLASPVAQLIRSSYGEDPKSHAEALSALNRARQDAVRGAGSDATARDLLYKWFHMLEMLELRFPELRVPFPWKDAFTQKPISQHSLAYEKASVIFNIASALSAIASRASRLSSSASSGAASAADASTASTTTAGPVPDGLKLSFLSLRQSAGMLSYINDNFLHAPSTDMSKDVVRWLVDLMLAQAHEVLWEKMVNEGKSASLAAKLAASAAEKYDHLEKESKEWVGKGVFNRAWAALVACKAKYFASIAQYYRANADHAAGNHGSNLVRLTLAETLAKQAQKLAGSFASSATGSAGSWSGGFGSLDSSPPGSPFATRSETSEAGQTLPSDAAETMQVLTATHLALVTGRKNVAVKDNDLIYHDILPPESTLPNIDTLTAATPISIQDIYSSPEVQKLIGVPVAGDGGTASRGGASGLASNDLFSRLVPLGVHEAASLYSEEKAQVARGEAERVDLADGELAAALEYMGLPSALLKFRGAGPAGLSQGAINSLADPGSEVRAWAEEERVGGASHDAEGLGQGGVEAALRSIDARKHASQSDLDAALRLLDEDNAACEKLRGRFGSGWKQEPQGAAARTLRSDAKSHKEALQQARANDDKLNELWNQARFGIQVLMGDRDELEGAFAQAVASASSDSHTGQAGLLDLTEDDERASDEELKALSRAVAAIEQHLSTLHKIKKSRADTLADLRAKIQSDDISHLLILNRRSPPEAQRSLFSQELEKFKAHQIKLASTSAEQEKVLAELAREWKEITESKVGRRVEGDWNKKFKAKAALIAKLKRAKETNAQARAGVAKAVQFYAEVEEVAAELKRSVSSFIDERSAERERLKSEAEWEEKGKDTSSASAASELNRSFGSLNMGAPRGPSSPPPSSAYQSPRTAQHTPGPYYPVPPPPAQGAYVSPSGPSSPTHPNPAPASPYEGLSAFESFGSFGASSAGTPRPPPPPAPTPQTVHASSSPATTQPNQSYPYPTPSQPGQQHLYQQQGAQPPPPPGRQPSLPPPPSQYTSSVPQGYAGAYVSATAAPSSQSQWQTSQPSAPGNYAPQYSSHYGSAPPPPLPSHYGAQQPQQQSWQSQSAPPPPPAQMYGYGQGRASTGPPPPPPPHGGYSSQSQQPQYGSQGYRPSY